jgi:hypothetical protein
MRIDVDREFRLELCRHEAEARGVLGRVRSLASAREADGLDPLDAELDACDQLGLGPALDDLLADLLAELTRLDVDAVAVTNAWSDVPTLRREGPSFRLQLAPSAFGALRGPTSTLVSSFTAEPERVSAVVVTGLGGNGGCAAGECLPEDAPPGPLFEPRVR